MRVTRIAFNGYQRLVDTSCSTAGKMIAFLGPNEAGKTTVLRALDWFSNGEGALPSKNRNNSTPPAADSTVVNVFYWLDLDDRAVLEDLPLAESPTGFTRGRMPDGTFVSNLVPKGRRSTTVFEVARSRFAKALESEPEPDPEESEPNLHELAETVSIALAEPDGSWQEEWEVEFQSALDVLEGKGNSEALQVLRQARNLLQEEHPDAVARARLRDRAPRFALFSDAERTLDSSYDLSDPALRENPPAALGNLAWLADLTLDSLWEAIDEGDGRRRSTAERRANEALKSRLGSRWSQKAIDVQLNVNGTSLEVQVFENSEDGAVTPVDERSDGLRTFIALVAFLARHNFVVPPVLLVDEAETHLHYDAQADLIEVLTNDVSAVQVFYTTHSPGCLPRDLGTGVRLVAPDKRRSDVSRLRNDFWTSDGPGFTPLLFAMGAGAAAFSAFRKAVLTEGAADMILLPSMLRTATRRSELEFQVAPGIANYHGSGLELEEVAARVVYLVDGDKGGQDHMDRLIAMGIPSNRVFMFEPPSALEDYVEPQQYLGVINDFLALSGFPEQIDPDDLERGISVSKAVERWCELRDVSPPGKTIVASHLVDSPGGVRLADGAEDRLVRLHDDLVRELSRVST